MRKLALPPERADIITHLPAGRGAGFPALARRFGQIEPHQPRALALQWLNINAAEFAYLAAFWRTATAEGARAFLIDLPIGGRDPIECRAHFIQPFRLQGVSFEGASVASQIHAMPTNPIYPLGAPADLAILDVAEEI